MESHEHSQSRRQAGHPHSRSQVTQSSPATRFESREPQLSTPTSIARSWALFEDNDSNDNRSARPPLPRRISLLFPQSLPVEANTPKRSSISGDQGDIDAESGLYTAETSRSPQGLSTEPLPLLNANISPPSITPFPQFGHEDTPTRPSALQRAKSFLRDLSTAQPLPTLTTTQKRVLKCSLAYFLASLFTYVTPLSGFLSDVTSDSDVPSPSGHMVATIAVYYNPAKTLGWLTKNVIPMQHTDQLAGAMAEADIFCLVGTVYAAIASLGSMALYWVLEVEPGWEWLGDALAISWVALCMCVVAWLKLWMAKPSFGTACSMISIIIFVVYVLILLNIRKLYYRGSVVKEGGLETLLQVSFIVLLGASISNLVCVTVWPETATKMLRRDIIRTIGSYSTLLDVLTNMFVLEAGDQYTSRQLQQAVTDRQASFISLKKNLQESRSEWLLTKSSIQAYEDAVMSLNRLAQRIGGLRGGVALQAEYLKAFDVLEAKRETSMEMNDDAERQAILDEASEKFGEVVGALGAPVQALSHACTTSLKLATESLENPTQWRLGDAHSELDHALMAFDSTSNHAIVRLYRHSQMLQRDWSNETVGSAPTPVDEREEVLFIVYFYVFTLREFAEELKHLINALTRVYLHQQQASWLHLGQFFWDSFPNRDHAGPRDSSSQASNQQSRSFSSRLDMKEVKRDLKVFLTIHPTAPDSQKLPPLSSLSWWGRVKQVCWIMGQHLRAPDKLYAIKTGIGIAILAAPGFFETTRPIFTEYRGEWALISFFVVMSPTIGATNFLALHRIGGTLLGAVVATAAYSAFHNQPLILSICGAIFSVPCFWLIVTKPQYATSGRFILLTYNLTCLFGYNIRHLSQPVVVIALHRTAAVVCGVVWALIISRAWWPSLARKEFSKTLSESLSKFGWYYTKLAASHTSLPGELARKCIIEGDDETVPLLREEGHAELDARIKQFQAMELHLQLQLIKLHTLLNQAKHEPRLKGPFPVALYKSILGSLQAILDRFHSMRCVTSNPDWYLYVNPAFMQSLKVERREMIGNVVLYFSILSSAFRLKTPMPPYLPPAEISRRRLIKAVRDSEAMTSKPLNTSGQLLYFAYVLTMKSVVKELEHIGDALQDAFGVMGGDIDNFERLFSHPCDVV